MSQEIRDGLLHEINPILVAEVDAFADMLEQRNLARDAAICLEQELAAAEAQLQAVRALSVTADDCWPVKWRLGYRQAMLRVRETLGDDLAALDA